jgi:transcription elongation factor GreB
MADGKINWQSPVARALMKARPGDEITVRTEGGSEVIEVVSVTYRL